MIVQITDEDVLMAHKISKIRNNAKTEDIRYKGLSNPYYVHFIGALAEIAFSKITNRPIDMNGYENKGDDSDFDDIELKTITYSGDEPHLKIKVREFKTKNPRVYILSKVNKDFTSVEFLGYITKRDFSKNYTMRNYGHGDRMTMKLSQMKPFQLEEFLLEK